MGEADWLYRCTFDVSADLLQAPHIDLCFDGLDTFATVWLNGVQLLTSDNMFIPHRLSVKTGTATLHAGQNTLHVLFESAVRLGREREAQYGKMPYWGDGEGSRLYVRKAQYHYGWDWGPILITAGIWRALRLEAYQTRIADVHCPVEVAADLRIATLPITVTLGGATNASLHLAVYDPADHLVSEQTVDIHGDTAQHTFTVTDPQLWWPNGYGAQPLYQLKATLSENGQLLDEHTQRIGLRRLELVQEPLENAPGTSFLFQINNMPIFCGGANWIPADSLTPRITADDYRDWLNLAVEANMVMLRIWGGGIYEDDMFYNLCDEMGLMVWQDFTFACGLYPAPDWFTASVRTEAEANVRRLRHHPSLVLWWR